MERIDWGWLKQTPPRSRGLIPGLGLRFTHLPASLMQCEQILVDNGTEDIRIIKDSRKKSGWTKPHPIEKSIW